MVLKRIILVSILIFCGLTLTESKEKLRVTDLLLDALLNLWVPENFQPSQQTQAITDRRMQEKRTIIEKEEAALQKYREHLFRYAEENDAGYRYIINMHNEINIMALIQWLEINIPIDIREGLKKLFENSPTLTERKRNNEEKQLVGARLLGLASSPSKKLPGKTKRNIPDSVFEQYGRVQYVPVEAYIAEPYPMPDYDQQPQASERYYRTYSPQELFNFQPIIYSVQPKFKAPIRQRNAEGIRNARQMQPTVVRNWYQPAVMDDEYSPYASSRISNQFSSPFYGEAQDAFDHIESPIQTQSESQNIKFQAKYESSDKQIPATSTTTEVAARKSKRTLEDLENENIKVNNQKKRNATVSESGEKVE